jgi:hypothetical protein
MAYDESPSHIPRTTMNIEQPIYLNLIWGVCILLRVWYRMIWVLIRLRNVNIVWWYITYTYNVAHNNGVSNDSQQNIDNNNNVRSYETTDPLSIE